MSSATGDFTARVDGVQNKLGRFTTALAGIDLVKNSLEGLKQATDAMSASGIALDTNMHELSAVAGVTCDDYAVLCLNEQPAEQANAEMGETVSGFTYTGDQPDGGALIKAKGMTYLCFTASRS